MSFSMVTSGVFAGHLFVRPGGCIRPALCASRRSLLLGLNDGISAENQKGWNQQRKEQENVFASLNLRDLRNDSKAELIPCNS